MIHVNDCGGYGVGMAKDSHKPQWSDLTSSLRISVGNDFKIVTHVSNILYNLNTNAHYINGLPQTFFGSLLYESKNNEMNGKNLQNSKKVFFGQKRIWTKKEEQDIW